MPTPKKFKKWKNQKIVGNNKMMYPMYTTRFVGIATCLGGFLIYV